MVMKAIFKVKMVILFSFLVIQLFILIRIHVTEQCPLRFFMSLFSNFLKLAQNQIFNFMDSKFKMCAIYLTY